MDQSRRKLMTMQKVLHSRDGVGRLYVAKKEGERGLTSIKDYIYARVQGCDKK